MEQLSISIRWVDQNYEINEDFVGMVGIESANASNLRSVILDCLLRSDLPLSGCCRQAYDGAAVMSGHLTGVTTQIGTKSNIYSLLGSFFKYWVTRMCISVHAYS